MQVQQFTFNFFAENTYVLYDDTNECVIIDPGCYHNEEKKALKDFILDNDLNPVKLLNTHCHLDHIFGNKFIAEEFNLDLHCHKNELSWIKQAPYYAQAMYNIKIEPSPMPKFFLDEDDKVNFGETTLDVLFTPGHSTGSITFYSEGSKTAIVGDVIFHRSIGRTDLPGGSFKELEKSIKTKIYTLPDDTILHAGHMESTTVGDEKKMNPFVTG
jgi:glyoxylase-like metal-dependent hydrolase (beta-lactamase superfamily II)